MRTVTPLARGEFITELTVDVANRSGSALTPHFAVTTGVDITQYWTITEGPEDVAARTSQRYTLTPADGRWKMPAAGPVYLRVVSDHPQTLSSQRLAD